MHRNVQKLSPLFLQRPHLSLQIESNAFSMGYTDALTKQTVRGFDVTNVDEATIVDIVQNICEIYSEDWPNFDEVSRYWSGVIVGIITRQNVEVLA